MEIVVNLVARFKYLLALQRNLGPTNRRFFILYPTLSKLCNYWTWHYTGTRTTLLHETGDCCEVLLVLQLKAGESWGSGMILVTTYMYKPAVQRQSDISYSQETSCHCNQWSHHSCRPPVVYSSPHISWRSRRGQSLCNWKWDMLHIAVNSDIHSQISQCTLAKIIVSDHFKDILLKLFCADHSGTNPSLISHSLDSG